MSMLNGGQMYFRPIKALGQNFLVNEAVAKAEAAHATGKHVIEIGPGYGALTRELCAEAEHVTAIEKDPNLYMLLRSELSYSNLTLINGDFFEMGEKELVLGNADILIANIPYNLSSKTIEWLSLHNIEAVLCLQKEFVDHMLAREGTPKYSRLSVMSALGFTITKIMNVSKGSFRPIPKVDSSIIYIKPKGKRIGSAERRVISLLMEHKKKTLRNAIIDSHASLGMEKKALAIIAEGMRNADERIFMMNPSSLLGVAGELVEKLGLS